MDIGVTQAHQPTVLLYRRPHLLLLHQMQLILRHPKVTVGIKKSFGLGVCVITGHDHQLQRDWPFLLLACLVLKSQDALNVHLQTTSLQSVCLSSCHLSRVLCSDPH